jgi:hypothetical protein
MSLSFNELPLEILTNIAFFLPPASRVHLDEVNKTFKELFSNSEYFKNLFLEKHPALKKNIEYGNSEQPEVKKVHEILFKEMHRLYPNSFWKALDYSEGNFNEEGDIDNLGPAFFNKSIPAFKAKLEEMKQSLENRALVDSFLDNIPSEMPNLLGHDLLKEILIMMGRAEPAIKNEPELTQALSLLKEVKGPLSLKTFEPINKIISSCHPKTSDEIWASIHLKYGVKTIDEILEDTNFPYHLSQRVEGQIENPLMNNLKTPNEFDKYVDVTILDLLEKTELQSSGVAEGIGID